jgi:hypothetical protein
MMSRCSNMAKSLDGLCEQGGGTARPDIGQPSMSAGKSQTKTVCDRF